MSRSPIGEERLGRRSEVEANALGNPCRLPCAVEVEVSEAGNRTEVGQSEGTRLDLFEVAVVAERLHGATDRRVDSTVGSLGHRVGNVQSFEEQRGDFDGAACVGV